MSEKVFYDDGDNKVTDKRFVVDGQTFPISNITSVKMDYHTVPAQYLTSSEVKTRAKSDKEIESEKGMIRANHKGSFWVGFFVFLGLASIFKFMGFGPGSGVIALIIGYFVGSFWGFSETKKLAERNVDPNVSYTEETTELYEKEYNVYKLLITTAAGQTQALSSTNDKDIKTIVDAINNAIIARG